jgi:hypothetical protein
LGRQFLGDCPSAGASVEDVLGATPSSASGSSLPFSAAVLEGSLVMLATTEALGAPIATTGIVAIGRGKDRAGQSDQHQHHRQPGHTDPDTLHRLL